MPLSVKAMVDLVIAQVDKIFVILVLVGCPVTE